MNQAILKGVRLLAFAAAVCAGAVATAEPFADGDVVVFFGDSITHGGRYHQYVSDYYATRFPERSVRFVNSGIGGDTASGAYPRIPEDVAEYNPTHVAFHFGMNDINRGAYKAESTAKSLAARENAQAGYRSNLPRLIAAVRKAAPNAKFIYLTPTPYEDTAIVTNAPKSGWASVNQVGCNVGLSLMAGFVIARAGRDKAECVDWFSVLNSFRVRHQKENPYFSFVRPDRVHPEELGHTIMAWEFLKSQGAPALVSSVEVDAKSGKVVRAENADVTDCASVAEGVRFSVLAKALPFPVHEKALPYVREFDVENALNRETVAVTGLAAGTYALKIDGTEVGRYAAKELEKGVSLGFNAKTPQYRQAQDVAARHAELRNRESKLRNHHSARWAFSGQAPVNDAAAFREWYEKDRQAGGKKTGGYFGQFIPGYLDYWPKYKEVRAELWRDQEQARALAKPVVRRYEVVRAADDAAVATGAELEKLQENPIPAVGQNAADVVGAADAKGLRVLFIGNSITLHGPKKDGTWTNNWGMAATARDKDYVHQLAALIRRDVPDSSFALLQVADKIERRIWNLDLERDFKWARDWKPDVITLFYGANVGKVYDEKQAGSRQFTKATEKVLDYIDPGRKAKVFHAEGFYIRPVLDAEKRELAAKRGDVFVPMDDLRRRKDTHGRYNHPGDLGMRMIAERFWEYIRPTLKLPAAP